MPDPAARLIYHPRRERRAFGPAVVYFDRIAGSQAAGQQLCQGSEHGTVCPVRPRTGDLPPQHRDLVPQDKDLRVLGGITPGQERQPAQRTGQGQVDETEQYD
jgi:hypothetical protein